jgi:branched-chain amino acid transport system substrate-binding protein
MVVADTRDLGPAAVTSAVERLLSDDDINMIMTGYASASNFEIESIAEAGMPYFLAGNSTQTAEIIAKNPDDFPTIWSFAPSYKLYETGVMPVVERWVSEKKLKLPNKKIAFITSDNPYSKSIYQGMIEDAKKRGWEITATDVVPYGEINDWRAFLSKTRQNPPAVIVNTDYLPGNAATFTSQFLENPTDSLVFIQYAPTVNEYLELTKEKGTGIITSTMLGVLPNDRAAMINKKYHDRYGIDASTYAEALYEMVYIYRDAIASGVDPTDRAAISKAISATKDRITALGVITFDPKTHLALDGDDYMPLQIFQVRDGKRVLLSPSRWANGEFQTPPWMKK